MIDYLTTIEVIAIHEDQILQYGGSEGIRDLGLLESALYRPQTGYYADVIEQAAALWESMGQNHPFLDGNKRTAFAVVYTFLDINNYNITASSQDTFVFISHLYNNKIFTLENLVSWLRLNTKQRNYNTKG